MAQTNRSNVIVRELYEDAVESAFADKMAFMGSQAASLGIVKVNGTFPYSNPEQIGQNINVPYFSSIGEFQSLNDGDLATTTQISQTKEQAVVTRGSLAWEITRWARSGTPGVDGRDIYAEAAAATMESATRYMDSLIITAATSGTNQLSIDKFSSTVPRNLDWDLIVDAKMKFKDFQDDIAALIVTSRTLGDLMKMKTSTGLPLLVQPTQDGSVPRVMGLPVIVSDRLPLDNSGLTAVAVTSTTGTPPVITVTQTTNAKGGTGPETAVDVVVAVTTIGARGAWKFKVSLDGGATYTADDFYTSAATVALIDPQNPTTNALLGVTLNIAAGTAALDHQWTFQSILKHTSLIAKKKALVFWYSRDALGLETIPVPQADSIVGATHLYGVAYRYQRLGGQPLPGIVKIRHNAGGL